MTLNREQQLLFARVVEQRESLYYGGDAGTGKTHVMAAMIEALRERGLSVVVCAPTGQAAQHLDGVTIHALFGLMPDGASVKMRGNWAMKKALAEADVIVIDEISMASEVLFAAMDRRMRTLRRRPWQPMGGVQTVALGDFCQLPPVGDAKTASGRFCFHAPAFSELFGPRTFKLTQPMRQADDPAFAALLSRMRVTPGGMSEDDARLLHARVYAVHARPMARPYLFSKRDATSAHNALCAQQLGADVPMYEWVADDWVARPDFSSMLQTLRLEERLELRVGAPVLLRVNVDQAARLVNGTRGVVTAIVPPCELGLRTCAACDVCKGEVPRPEHEWAQLIGMMPRDSRVPVALVRFERRELGPIVCAVGMWTVEKARPGKRGGAKRAAAAAADDTPADDELPPVLCRRSQVPLMLGWAFTIHKAQGMTMEDGLCVSLGNLFEAGQAYVALSRARTLADVYIMHRGAARTIPLGAVRAAPDAVEFEKRMAPL